ncbi:uncharacterized protein [Apostichopus japonicus]|uniref:uncharacterized protein n=1 Tax=Stichopus japonicus TaxID=307972 RepID=UPI003AB8C4C0
MVYAQKFTADDIHLYFTADDRSAIFETMANLHRVREAITLGYLTDLLDDDEFMLLYDNNKPSNPEFQYYDYDPFDLEDYNDDECNAYFRFKKDDLYRLKDALQIPERIKCTNGYRVQGLEAICILLSRFAYPCRYGDMVKTFARDVPQLCTISTHMINFVYSEHSYLVETLNRFWLSSEHLMRYASAIHAKGAALKNCWGFVDGTVRPICRPKEYQRLCYNGHKRVHALKYQSVTAANGLVANLFGPIEGRRHDCFLLRESGLLTELEHRSYDTLGNTLCIYGDPAYPLRAHLQGPFKGNLTNDQKLYNHSMSSVRVSVEWVFGDMINFFKSTDFKKNQKMGLSACGKMYIVSGILTNAHTCLYGNSTSKFFELEPPTFEQYFQR